jgi:SAM-dependent methyltransferase
MLPPKHREKPLLLDFGCGSGQLLRRFRHYGFAVDGYDVDPQAIQFARKYARRVYSGDVFRVPFEGPYDVILMNQVLEHLHDPLRVLTHLRSSLKPEGQLIISVPNAACVDFFMLGDAWTGFQAPIHTFHFHQRSLHRLLDLAGYNVLDTFYASRFKAWRPSGVRQQLMNLDRLEPGRARRAVKKFLYVLSLLLVCVPVLGRWKSDRITVYCRTDHDHSSLGRPRMSRAVDSHQP